MVPGDLRYTKDHEWVRVDGDEALVGITEYAADQLGDIVFVELPDAGRDARGSTATFGVVESVKAVSDLFAPVAGEVVAANDGARRASPSSSTTTRTATGWMLRVKLADAAQAERPARRRGLRAADRRGLTMPYGPHTADDRARMLATIGIASVDELFEDIPAALRAERAPPRPARARARAVRAAQALAGAQPRGPRLVPGRGRVPPLDARRSSTSCCSGASGTRPTRRTSPRSARARSRASTSTSRCSRS